MVNNMTDLTAQEPAWQTRDHLDDPVIGELRNRFGPDAFTVQATRTGVPVVWIKREQLLEVGDFLLPKAAGRKSEIRRQAELCPPACKFAQSGTGSDGAAFATSGCCSGPSTAGCSAPVQTGRNPRLI